MHFALELSCIARQFENTSYMSCTVLRNSWRLPLKYTYAQADAARTIGTGLQGACLIGM